jgi:hypothetical protein
MVEWLVYKSTVPCLRNQPGIALVSFLLAVYLLTANMNRPNRGYIKKPKRYLQLNERYENEFEPIFHLVWDKYRYRAK